MTATQGNHRDVEGSGLNWRYSNGNTLTIFVPLQQGAGDEALMLKSIKLRGAGNSVTEGTRFRAAAATPFCRSICSDCRRCFTLACAPLSRLTPTVVYHSAPWAADGREQTRRTGAALGLPVRVEEMSAATNAIFTGLGAQYAEIS